MSRRKTLTETAMAILSEAAVDHLQASARVDQDPMQQGPFPTSYQTSGPDPLETGEHDLGGSTTMDPAGGPVGMRASAFAKPALQPQTAKTGKPQSPSEQMQSGPFPTSSPSAQMPNMVKAEAQPTMATPSGQAPLQTPGATEYVPVDPMEESLELTAEEVAQIKAQRRASIVEYMQQMSVDEDIAAMFAGTGVSPDFAVKAKGIFEAAVIARAVAVAEKLEEEILQAAEESVAEMKEDLEVKVDGYLNHVVENWMVKNEVAIESGLKTEIVEGFIYGLKNLFTEHYIDVPEQQVNVVEALASEVEELKGKLNETLNNNIELARRINEGVKFQTLAKVCEGLTTTQAEKLQMLAEGVEFTSESEYAKKLLTVRESYFPKVNKQFAVSNPVVLSESAEPTPVEVQNTVDPSMSVYMNALKRHAKK